MAERKKRKHNKKMNNMFSKVLRLIVCMAIVSAVLVAAAFGMRTVHDNYVYSTYPLKYESYVDDASKRYGVDKYLIYGVIKTESNFDPDAVSHVGAQGLMQLMPDSFEWIQTYYTDEEYQKYTFEDLSDPAVNIDYGTHLLSILLDMYEVEDTAVCAYNAGVGNVNSWLEDKQYSDDGKHLKIVPFPETENYRHSVAQNKSCYTELYKEE